MTSQWPQQNYQNHSGYGYPQYPQQYQQPPPQQYTQHPQQYDQQVQQYAAPHIQPQYPQYPPQPQQQYPPQQAVPYPSQYPAATDATYPPPNQPQPNQQGCYNCGNPGHWAQSCPEPRRDVPAGTYNRPPPFKRHKPNPPVVTRYVVPPHVHQNQGQPPNGYGAQYPPQSYPQYQGPSGPPTPMSGHSPSHQQWQQQPYPQQYQQPYPQQLQYPQPYQQQAYPQPPYQQQHQNYPQYHQQQQQQPAYMPTAPSTPVTPYGSRYPNQASPHAVQANAASYLQNYQHQQQLGSQSQPTTAASPVSAISRTVSSQQQPYSPLAGKEKGKTNHSSRNSSVSMHSMSVTPKQQSIEVREEQEDDSEDLTQLDIADIPVITDGSFANLVERPLPTNFIVADALEPFDPPPPEQNGRCQSKYVTIDASVTFMGSIRDTKHWEDLKNDPMFLSIQDGGRILSLDDVVMLYRPQPAPDEYIPPDIEEGEWTQQSADQHEADRDVMDRLEHSLSLKQSNNSTVAAPRTISLDHVSHRDSGTHNKIRGMSEDAKALHMVDGACRPGRNFIPPPPATAESPAASPERTPPPRSRTPSMYELNEIYRQEYGTRPGSTLDEKPSASGDSRSAPISDPFEPPPPPAHLRKPASYDGTVEEPVLAGSPNGCSNGNGISGTNHRNGIGRSFSNGHSASPTRVRSDAANGRKRDHDEKAMSDEDNTPKRRQVDDTKSKLKKRQPQVAAAYR
ncbi:MAG: hypothetical protein Q9219_005773 [cf. Caloplaca sp. 3 TL-2023]